MLFFITPKTVAKLGTKAAEFVPFIGPGVEYVKKAQKLTDISDPVTASSRGVGMIFKSCFGKTAVVSVECALWLGFSVAGGITANPVLIGLGAQMGNLIVDELID
jgi:hypothetical protein